MAATTKTWLNNNAPSCEDDDLNGFKDENNNLILGSSQALNVGDRQQSHKSVAHYSSVGQFFTGGGIADAYTAAIIAPRIAPPSLIKGMELNLIIPATSTGASTLNAFGSGAVAVKLEGGVSDPIAGDMESGKLARFKYFTSPSAYWEIVNAKVSNGATQAETDAGVIDTKFVSPKKMRFGFSILLAANGYITFPSWMGGVILQWATKSAIPNNTAITFPIAFPTACLVLTFGDKNVGGGAAGAHIVSHDSLSASGFTAGVFLHSGIADTTSFTFLAIGH